MSQADNAQDRDRLLKQLEHKLAGWDDPAVRLRQALELDDLELYAQPILALRGSGGFPIAEVLVRLREEPTLLPSVDFLPVFEHCGMLPEFVPEIAAKLARANVSCGSLVFEISESAVFASPVATKQFAESARAIGCRLMIDGFGERAVSFDMLTKLRTDYLKVDGVIVRSLASKQFARHKLNAIVQAGEILGIGVIGECVENDQTLAHLRAAGAGYAQGFGIHDACAD
jgi:EAL domain-containing protein (putative c-di-GMP-specific phosphodiesterase class I)